MKIVIVDDGPTFDYRIRLFKRIVELYSDCKITLYSEGYLSLETHPRLNFVQTKIQKGKYLWKYLGPLVFENSSVVVFPFNWRIYNLIIFGLLNRYLFWGGGFRSSTLDSVFCRLTIHIFSFVSPGLLLYKTQKLKNISGRLYFFQNISKLAYQHPKMFDRPSSTHNDYYLFIGTFKPEKCLYEFLDKYLNNKIKHKLILIGDGPDGERLKELVRSRGAQSRIMFEGSIQNPDILYSYLTNALAVVSPGQCGLLAQDAIYANKNFFGVLHPDSGPEFEELNFYDNSYLFRSINELINFLKKPFGIKNNINLIKNDLDKIVAGQVISFLKSNNK